jgi:hypothetical protein
MVAAGMFVTYYLLLSLPALVLVMWYDDVLASHRRKAKGNQHADHNLDSGNLRAW